MLFIYRFFRGVLKVEFFGVYPEKVLNLCSKNGIYIWSARYQKGRICCKITVPSFFKLRSVLRKSGIRVHILEKCGFPFFIRRYKNRFGIYIGLIVFMAFLQVMSSYIWVVDVVGNKTVSSEQILLDCENLGIKTGIRKGKINAKADAQELLLNNSELAWGSFNIEGSKLTVNVTEITHKSSEDFEYSNLVANADGIIKKIDVKSGDCVVKVGDIIKKGDVLVSGVIETLEGTRFVRSKGEITAVTETEINLEQPLKRTESYNTGKTKTKRVLEVFTLKIPLYLGAEKGKYDSLKSEKNLKLLGKNIPIKIYEKRFVFKTEQTVEIERAEAKERLEKRLYEKFEKVKNITFFETDKAVSLNAVAIEEKNIASAQNMMVNKEK